MSTHTGELGLVTWAGVNSGYTAYAFGWTLNESTETRDDTVFQPSGGHRSFLPGLITGNGSVSCYLNASATLPSGRAASSMVLQSTTSSTFTFSAFITKVAIGAKVDDVVTLDIDFQVDGAITQVASGA